MSGPSGECRGFLWWKRHEWGPWLTREGADVRRCLGCARRNQRPHRHIWGPWTLRTAGEDTRYARCFRCGAMVEEKTP